VSPGLGSHLIVIALLLALYVPLAGSYTLFDPWEGHYAEVARTMNATGNYLSPRWQDENFWSKPAGQLWLLAFSMRLLGVGRGAPDEMVASSLPEWSLRLPIIVISVFGLWAMWLLVTRLVSRRAGWLARLQAAPQVELARQGEVRPYRAEVGDPDALREPLNRAMAAKYGAADRLLALLIDPAISVPVRLVPDPTRESASRVAPGEHARPQ
jgi:hypothetical protein